MSIITIVINNAEQRHVDDQPPERKLALEMHVTKSNGKSRL